MKMFSRTIVLYAGIAVLLGGGLLLLLLYGPRWLTTPATPQEAQQTVPPPADARKIRARLFYVNEQGTGLTSVEQEVVYGEGVIEQAKRIVEAQLSAPQEPMASAIPPDTKLRTVFVTSAGDTYVDLSGEVQKNHPGGATNEILTVYTVVAALTTNLPAITSVQILVEGREVDTLAGHLDLRRPIEAAPKWITD